jgi:hypothetical protein
MPPASEQSPSAFLIGVFVLHSNQKLEQFKNNELSIKIYQLDIKNHPKERRIPLSGWLID